MEASAAYSFRIKANPAEIILPVLRSLLFLGAILVLLTGNEKEGYLYWIPAILLLTGSLLAGRLLLMYRLHPLLVAGAASMILFAGTGNILAPLVLAGLTLVLQFRYRAPTIEMTETGIRIRKTFYTRQYSWEMFSNVLLRDQLLTLDFRNNRLLQLEIDGEAPNQTAFNLFCGEQLQKSAA